MEVEQHGVGGEDRVAGVGAGAGEPGVGGDEAEGAQKDVAVEGEEAGAGWGPWRRAASAGGCVNSAGREDGECRGGSRSILRRAWRWRYRRCPNAGREREKGPTATLTRLMTA